mmetsp:Transcript_49087/g.140543  ORF Transcript_49087/g.140543 Transcript_49087/m.140543 type:complete len:309 (+) Transcript_49087:388-1314(+)
MACRAFQSVECLQGTLGCQPGCANSQVHVQYPTFGVELSHAAREEWLTWQAQGLVLRLDCSHYRRPHALDRRPRCERLQRLREDAVVQAEVSEVGDGKRQGVPGLARRRAAPDAARAPHERPQGALLQGHLQSAALEQQRRRRGVLQAHAPETEPGGLHGRAHPPPRGIPDRLRQTELLAVHETARCGTQGCGQPGNLSHPGGSSVPVRKDYTLVLDHLRERLDPNDGRCHDAETALAPQDQARKLDVGRRTAKCCSSWQSSGLCAPMVLPQHARGSCHPDLHQQIFNVPVPGTFHATRTCCNPTPKS